MRQNNIFKHISNGVVTMLLCIVATCLFSACHDDDEKKEPEYVADETMADSRTILVYMVAENSLSQYCREDIQEMLDGVNASKLKKGDNLVIYLDGSSIPRIYHLNGTDTVSYFSLDPEYSKLKPVKEYKEDVNSASADVLGEVVDYVKEKYPAQSYGLVLWSHGSGWIPSTNYDDNHAKHRKTFGIDNGNNSPGSNVGNQMNIPAMARVLEKKCYFDFMFFDACFMQCIEVDYELRKCAKYVIGSPAEIPGPGADYKTLIPAMFKDKDYAKLMVETYHKTYENDYTYGVVLSAVNEAALENFASYMKTVCKEKRSSLMSLDMDNVLNYFNYQRYGYNNMPDFVDIKGVAKNALDEEAYSVWQSEFDKIIEASMFTSTWYSQYPNCSMSVDAEQCGGVSMFVPLEWRYSYHGYSYPNLYMDTEWGKYVWENLIY